MKLADQLKSMSLPNTPAYRAGEMLLECERVLAAACAEAEASGNWDKAPFKSWYYKMAATLAELRGEA